MKSRYLLLAGIAVMACLAGCSDNSLDNGMAKNPVQEGEEILFGSSLSDEVESRTVYGDRDENGVAVHWVDGDEIAIFCKETSQPANHLVNYKIKPNAGDPSKASEVMKVDPNAAGLQWGKDELHHFYAFYPASAVHGAESDSGNHKNNIHLSFSDFQERLFPSPDCLKRHQPEFPPILHLK